MLSDALGEGGGVTLTDALSEEELVSDGEGDALAASEMVKEADKDGQEVTDRTTEAVCDEVVEGTMLAVEDAIAVGVSLSNNEKLDDDDVEGKGVDVDDA